MELPKPNLCSLKWPFGHHMCQAKQLHWKFIHDPNRHQEVGIWWKNERCCCFLKNDVSLRVWKGGDRFFYEMWATLFGTFRSWLVTRNFACEKDASLLHMSGITSKNRYRDIRYRAMTYTSTHMAALHMPWRYSWLDKLLWNNHRKLGISSKEAKGHGGVVKAWLESKISLQDWSGIQSNRGCGNPADFKLREAGGISPRGTELVCSCS